MDGGTDMSGYDAVGVQTNDGGIAMFDTDTLTASNPGNEPGYYSEFFESVTEDSWSDLFDSPDEVERLVEHGLTTTAPPDGVTDDEVVEAMKEVADIVEVVRPVSPPPVRPGPTRTTRTKPRPRPITYVSIGYTDTPIGVANHALVIGTDAVTGEQVATRAGPGGLTIEAVTDVFDAYFEDPPSEVHTTQELGVLNASLADFYDSAATFADRMNRNGIGYAGWTSNSNSYAFTFVESLGFERPTPEVWAPGWDYVLPLHRRPSISEYAP